MSEYRTGGHWGVTIVRVGTQAPDVCLPIGRRPDDQLVAVVVNGDRELAERICALLNAEVGPCPVAVDTGLSAPFMHRCELQAGHAGDHKDGGMRWWEVAADPCTCSTGTAAGTAPDPFCPVHRGRKARGL